ncbi:hypothetical protein MKEN_00791500 [Mycena kentingensis (nom. inval.)]|nr:hypothetical protein MKEN_00791500 [Mycena kentingensis (nom. inval.)]
MSPQLKRQRQSDDDSDDRSDVSNVEDASEDSEGSSSDHIGDLRPQKSQQTKKRKIRASGATAFGETLQSLLSTNAPSDLPLSLKPSVSRKRNDEKLELKAKKVLQVERKEKDDKGRIKDVIGGWGGESERALRKVAQRGVVKLFNVIQQSQASAAAEVEEKKASRGTGKASLPAPVIKEAGKKAAADKLATKDVFLDFIRAGGVATASSSSRPQKITVLPEDFQRRLHEVQVSKHDLNRLIMDYLVVEGYKSAAEEFCQEANLPAPVNFESIESRMNIRDALHRGDVEDAIARVNDLNPEIKTIHAPLSDPRILDTNPALYFHLQQQRLIEYIRDGRISEALQFAQDELAPRGEESPEFLSELERTMALLAFDALPSAPPGIAELLSPAQRMKTAGEVNAAILDSMSQAKEVKLMQMLKLLEWSDKELSERADYPRLTL